MQGDKQTNKHAENRQRKTYSIQKDNIHNIHNQTERRTADRKMRRNSVI